MKNRDASAMPLERAIAMEWEWRKASPRKMTQWRLGLQGLTKRCSRLSSGGRRGGWHGPGGLDGWGVALAAIHVLRGLHEIGRFCVWYVQEGLRIAIREREPGTLNLHHDAMAAAKSMIHVLHREGHFFNFARDERLRNLKTVAKFSAERFSAHQLLISAHGEGRRGHIRQRLAFGFRTWLV